MAIGVVEDSGLLATRVGGGCGLLARQWWWVVRWNNCGRAQACMMPLVCIIYERCTVTPYGELSKQLKHRPAVFTMDVRCWWSLITVH